MVINRKQNFIHNNIAIIPARGGSKRIPRKNIIDFNGKPMIAWTIEAALKSKLFSKVIVSTDSEEIAGISRDYGADVPFLRSTFSDDISPVSQATYSALIQAEEFWNTNFDTVTQLMPNCPLRTKIDIVHFHDEFFDSDANFLLSCFKFGWMNPWWAFKLDEQKNHSFLFDNKIKMRSQDLDDLFCPTGSIWMARAEEFKRSKSFYGKKQKFGEISWVSAMDIDDENDLDFAKALFLQYGSLR
ncbi:acylneuraminate cytidylyltransferase family protein [Gammaproteobacteria bacterium]|nr:acylneuraminate cytidylyltransferase family protein [Gammaproteobacteria bacterium]